jgi:hypothetical protein
MQEYLAGMDCPLLNASLVSWRDMFASAEVGTAVAGKVVAGWMGAAFVLTGAGVLIEDGAQAESSMAMNTNKHENFFISSPRV